MNNVDFLSSRCGGRLTEVVAAPVNQRFQLNAGNPADEWKRAAPVSFCADWRGENPDPARQTQVRVLWSVEALYLRLDCRYQTLHVFPTSDPSGRCDHLWERDVAEAFLQPEGSEFRSYKEFEVAPNGSWLDLDVSSSRVFRDLRSGLTRSVWVDELSRTWAAELEIPMASLTAHFDPTKIWHANFYRVEGVAEPRAYLAWQPTKTLHPDFHVPSAFGELRFAASAKY